jgi:hypothetical protein
MPDSPAVSQLGAESRRWLRRLRLTTAGLALLLLVPFVLLVVALIRSDPIHPFLLAGALGFGVPPLLALSHLRQGPAPIGLRLAAAVAFVALLGAGLVVVLSIQLGREAGWFLAIAAAVGGLAWVALRDATALRKEIGGTVDWRGSWGWAKLRVAAFYVLDVMVMGCGGLITLKDPRRISVREATAIGEIRTVISAQAAYQSANGGHYEGNLRCLAEPYSGCLPGYPANAPTFLDSSIASLTPRAGYVREFVAGPSPKRLDPRQSSPTSVTAYSYSARPEQYRRGYRSFFGDETGVIRSTRENRPATANDPPIE